MQKGLFHTPARRGSFSQQSDAVAESVGLRSDRLTGEAEKQRSPADVGYQFRSFMTPESAKLEKGSDGYETPDRDHRSRGDRKDGSLFYAENVSDGDITVTNSSSPDCLAEWPSETVQRSSQLSKKFLGNHVAECSQRCPAASPLAAGRGNTVTDASGVPLAISVSSMWPSPVHPAGSDVPAGSGTREWCGATENGFSKGRLSLRPNAERKRCCMRIALSWKSFRRHCKKAAFFVKTKTGCGRCMAQCLLRLQYLRWIGVFQIGCVVVFLSLVLFLCLNPLGISVHFNREKDTQGALQRRHPALAGSSVDIRPGYGFYPFLDGQDWPDVAEASGIKTGRPRRDVLLDAPPSGLSRNWAPRLFQASEGLLTDDNNTHLELADADASPFVNQEGPPLVVGWKEARSSPAGDYQHPNQTALVGSKENVLNRMLKKERFALTWGYLLEEKDLPYVGSQLYLQQLFPVAKPILERDVIDENAQDEHQKTLYSPPASISHHYYNTLAVFPYQDDARRHGRLGVSTDGIAQYIPAGLPLAVHLRLDTGESSIRSQGYDAELLNALPLDREAVDHRSAACREVAASNEKNASYLLGLEDVSIVIAFRNTPMSALLRTLHSVLNRTPPALLREIILVDDGSNATSIFRRDGFLQTYIRTLPKVKLMVMPQRKGLSFARAQGVFMSTAPIVAILDPFLEVNDGWLEPLLEELNINRKAVVYPRILPINPRTFALEPEPQFGCPLSFNWHMRDTPGPMLPPETIKSVSSPMLPSRAAFVMRVRWLKRFGLFDTELAADNVEHVDLALRTWQCGGSVVCSPCSIVYVVPVEPAPDPVVSEDAQRVSRLRIAKLWTDSFYPLIETLLRPSFPVSDAYLGDLKKTLDLKNRLQCKGFDWYLQHVASLVLPRSPRAFGFWGTIRLRATENNDDENSVRCLDGRRYETADKRVELRRCHGFGDSQVFFTIAGNGEQMDNGIPRSTPQRGPFVLRFGLVPSLCLGHDLRLRNCDQEKESSAGNQPSKVDESFMWINKTESAQVQSVHSSGLCWTARVARDTEDTQLERLTSLNSTLLLNGEETALETRTFTWSRSNNVHWELSVDVCTTSPHSGANTLQQWHWVPEVSMNPMPV